MKKIVILNGPNLNLLGKREVDIYGSISFETYLQKLKEKFKNVEFTYLQSNVEGELINILQEHGFSADGIIFNPGGYSHTSVAIGDAVAVITTPVVEVHISNIHNREEYRQISFVSAKSVGTISGFGLKGYDLAVAYLLTMNE